MLRPQDSLNQFSVNRIHDRFEPVLGAQLLVDMVPVTSKCLEADVK